VIHAPFSRWAIPLTVIAAVAEEVLFRRVAYGWLLRWGAPVAVIGSALAFAVLHVPLYGIAVLPVDLGAGLLLSWQRWATGTWTVPAATHAAANVIATVLR
jgi:membrane protease YdiL (CAAX protease family)